MLLISKADRVLARDSREFNNLTAERQIVSSHELSGLGIRTGLYHSLRVSGV